MGEDFVRYIMKRLKNIDIADPLHRLTYKDAMERYGSDKPDIRYGMEIANLSDLVKGCGFSVFASAVETAAASGASR